MYFQCNATQYDTKSLGCHKFSVHIALKYLPFFSTCFKLSVLGKRSHPRMEGLLEKHFNIAPVPWLCCFPDKRTNWLRHVTVTLCTSWSIQRLFYSLVLLAHRQSAVLPSQLVDSQSSHTSFSVPRRFLVSHAADHSAGSIWRHSSSRQSYCCRKSYSHPGRLLADRAVLKRTLNISKVVLPYINLLRLGIQEFIEDFIVVNLPWVLESSGFFHFIKSALHCGLPHASLPVQFTSCALKAPLL